MTIIGRLSKGEFEQLMSWGGARFWRLQKGFEGSREEEERFNIFFSFPLSIVLHFVSDSGLV